LRTCGALGGLALADAEVKPGALQELTLLRVALNDRSEGRRGAVEVVLLQGTDSGFVQGDCLVESRFAWGDRRRWRFLPLGWNARLGAKGGSC